ncbi:MAG: PAS domain S-box protein [Deltaproteobacteria bacterium]|nr:MAG: PAS domain S-box protein [Deltaproteobacteria bacterium]
MNSVKNFIHEVIHCGCETFEERRKLLLPTFIISTVVTLSFYGTYVFPKWGFGHIVTQTHLIGSSIVFLGFIAALFLSKKFKINPILAFPSLASSAAAILYLSNAEFYAYKNDIWLHYQIMSVIFASFLASIRCNLILAVINIFAPIIIGLNMGHIDFSLIIEKQGIIHVATLISFYLSYQNTINKREVYKKYAEADRLGREKADLVDTLSSIAIISHTDADGIITDVNSNFCEISGYNKEELIGKDHNIVNSGEHPIEFFEQMWNTLTSNQIWTGEIKNISKNGDEYWIYSAIKPKHDAKDNLTGFISIALDVTKRKDIEKELDEERTKLIQTSKLATLGEMAAGVAHEINNPLAIISGSASVMTKFKSDPDRIVDMAEKIKKASERIHKIVKGLKKFSRSAEEINKKVHILDYILEESLELTRARARRHNVNLNITPLSSVEVECDDVQISQVLVNLISNAIDAVSGEEDAWVEVTMQESTHIAQIIVKDSGVGIGFETLEKIFVPFYTTKEIGKGTGLGLSISKGIVQDHNGELDYQKLDGHTAFILTLPKHRRSDVA